MLIHSASLNANELFPSVDGIPMVFENLNGLSRCLLYLKLHQNIMKMVLGGSPIGKRGCAKIHPMMDMHPDQPAWA
jgi:hypothetical protein